MKKKIKDRHLDTPGEANRDKHINFVALENNDEDPADYNQKGKLSVYRTDREQIGKKSMVKRPKAPPRCREQQNKIVWICV